MTAVFINGRFVTSDEEQVKEMMGEIKAEGTNRSNHPYIYVDETDKEIDSEALSPMEVVRMKAKEEARRELLAEQELERARAMNINNVSNTQSDAFKTSLANSRTIAQVLEGESHQQFQKAPSAGAQVGIGIAAHNNPMASDVLVPTVTVPVNVPTSTGQVIQESAVAPAPAAPVGDEAKNRLANIAAKLNNKE